MLLVVGLHSSLEVGQMVVNLLVDGHVNLGGSSPEHYYTVNTGGFLEVADVLAESFNHLPAGLALHDVVAVEALSVVVVESGLHGHDLLELVLYRLDILLLEHFGVHCALVSVGGIYVPRAEYDVVEVGQGHDFVVFEIFLVSAFSYTDFVILCHGANGLGKAFAGHQNAGHESGGHCTQTNNQYAEFALGFLYITHFGKYKFFPVFLMVK